MHGTQYDVETFAECLPAGIVVLDRSGQVEFHNEMALQLLGISVHDLPPGEFGELVEDERVRQIVSRISAGEVAAEHLVFETRGRHVACTARSLGDGSVDGVGTVLMLEDAAKYRQMENVKREFVDTILQKIRGPLATIKTSMSMFSAVDMPGMPSDMREVLDMSRHEVNRLNLLLNDLRDLFLIETGLAGKEMDLEVFPIGKALESAMDRVRKQLPPGEPLSDRVKSSGDLSATVYGDFESVKRVLVVLLSNACTCSPKDGCVRVNCSIECGHTCIKVRDHGIGIAADMMPLLFTKFFREDNSVTRNTDGNGLGLFIARSLVELMNGTIDCESVQGRGTTFVVSLPCGEC